MRRLIHLIAAATLLFASSGQPLWGADGTEEQQIAVILSGATPQQKDTACLRLKQIGTVAAVPALASLLTDEQLSHAARNALETIPGLEAGRALVEALDKTSGLTQVGIIDSLGYRCEAQAGQKLSKLIDSADESVGIAAAAALGKIGDRTAIQALQQSLPSAKAAKREAVLDGLLAAAYCQIKLGDMASANAIFQSLFTAKEKDSMREAAYEGMIRAAGANALQLVAAAIAGNDPAIQRAALQMARELKDSNTTTVLTGLLSQTGPAVQIALIEALNQRGDASAVPAILAAAKSKDADVRTAAFNALGNLGGVSAVPALATAATSSDKNEQKAARQALLQLPNIADALQKQLPASSPAEQVEIIRALGGRAEKGNATKLLDIARTGPDTARSAALKALTPMAGNADLASLVQLLMESKNESARAAVQETLISVCQRLQGNPGFDATPIVDGLNRGQPEDRQALFPVAITLTDAKVRTALRAGTTDANAQVKTAALRALCDARDPELLPDLLVIARSASEPNLRTLAFRGYTRLVTDEDNSKLTSAKRVDLLRQLLEISRNAEEKRQVLSGLSGVPDPAAMPLALGLLSDAETGPEAEQAVTRIASESCGADSQTARAALQKVLAVTKDNGRRHAAEAVLKQIDELASYLTDWQVAGPYRQDGKDYAALFDIPFGPEAPNAQDAAWRRLPHGTNPKQPWLLDLLKFLGGEQCVAYVQTRIYSDKDQPARLEMGTDDGVKAWLNGTQIHAKNVARPLTADSDKVDIRLKSGWNLLRLKITQNGMGWEYRVRLVKPDGTPIEGIKCSAEAAEASNSK